MQTETSQIQRQPHLPHLPLLRITRQESHLILLPEQSFSKHISLMHSLLSKKASTTQQNTPFLGIIYFSDYDRATAATAAPAPAYLPDPKLRADCHHGKNPTTTPYCLSPTEFKASTYSFLSVFSFPLIQALKPKVRSFSPAICLLPPIYCE